MPSITAWEKAVIDRLAKEFFAQVDLCPDCLAKLWEGLREEGWEITLTARQERTLAKGIQEAAKREDRGKMGGAN